MHGTYLTLSPTPPTPPSLFLLPCFSSTTNRRRRSSPSPRRSFPGSPPHACPPAMAAAGQGRSSAQRSASGRTAGLARAWRGRIWHFPLAPPPWTAALSGHGVSMAGPRHRRARSTAVAERGHGRAGGPALLLRPPPVPLRRPLVLRRRPQGGGRLRATPLAARPAPLATPPRRELGFGCGGPSAAVKVGPTASRGGAEQLGLCPPTLWDLAADRIGARTAATSIALPTAACVNAGSSPRRRHAACSALVAALAPPPSLPPTSFPAARRADLGYAASGRR
ncbi:hypothetical protein PVAP13_9KG144426 [Panicum virgatum]|uniref:Uncharacterized protein n=1 Tax=Panicum virgatum TaxID=38727 RepID=A0A8T0NRN5_PANVG|nr:hypothetical protein PVAP13_9KG144426 [Panicum virgatum]